MGDVDQDSDSTTPPLSPRGELEEAQKVREFRRVCDELEELKAFKEVEARRVAREALESSHPPPPDPQVCFLGPSVWLV